MKQNDLDIRIKEGRYNKSKVASDGITHIIDTDTSYKMYSLEIHKDYFTEDKDEVIQNIIQDLETLLQTLKQKTNSKDDNEISR